MRPTTLGQKLLLIISGLFVALALGEGFFRIAGFVASNTKRADSEKNGSYKILCVGDSSTYGLGASDPEKFSYPARLQQILDERAHTGKFDVINLGIPGINSSQVLNRMRSNIATYRPDLVIIMVGINDPWNLEESNILTFYDASGFETLVMDLDLLINRLRIYRFLKLSYLSREMKHADSPHELRFPGLTDETKGRGFQFSPLNDAKSSALNAALRHNTLTMKLIAEENHANVMYMKYHNVGWGRPEIVLNRFYPTLDVPIVDNESLFLKAAALGLNVRGEDGWHPNDLGYLLIAKNVFNSMVSSGVLEGAPIAMFESK